MSAPQTPAATASCRSDGHRRARWSASARAPPATSGTRARVLAEHGRYAFLRQGAAFQLPYLRSMDELTDYIAHHRIEFALFDGRTLRREPKPHRAGAGGPERLAPGLDPTRGLVRRRRPYLAGQAQVALRRRTAGWSRRCDPRGHTPDLCETLGGVLSFGRPACRTPMAGPEEASLNLKAVRDNFTQYGLHAVGMVQALEAYAGEGARGLVSYVESNNFPSLRSCYRLGYADIGKIFVLRPAQQFLIFGTKRCAERGVWVEARSPGKRAAGARGGTDRVTPEGLTGASGISSRSSHRAARCAPGPRGHRRARVPDEGGGHPGQDPGAALQAAARRLGRRGWPPGGASPSGRDQGGPGCLVAGAA